MHSIRDHGIRALALVWLFAGAAFAQLDERKTTVGVPARIEQLKLPGPELEAAPRETDEIPVVLRVIDVFPHGTEFRYDFEYYALEPGTYDLGDYLKRVDGQPKDIPAIPVEVAAMLPPGQVLPTELDAKRSRFLGGYRILLVFAGFLWGLGLLAILFVGRNKKKASAGEETRPKTLADRLRPMVERAMKGELPTEETAQLERTLVAYWRRRLGLEGHDAADAIRELRAHGEAGSLLEQLEIWLHRPGSSGDVDVAKLLEPYRDLPADAVEIRSSEPQMTGSD